QEDFIRQPEAPAVGEFANEHVRIDALGVFADACNAGLSPHQRHREGFAGADRVWTDQFDNRLQEARAVAHTGSRGLRRSPTLSILRIVALSFDEGDVSLIGQPPGNLYAIGVGPPAVEADINHQPAQSLRVLHDLV